MQLLVMLAIALGLLVVASLPGVVLAVAGVDIMSRPVMLWTQAFTQLLTFLVPVLLMTTIYYRGSQREYYGLDFSGRTWYYALAGMVVMLLIMPVNDWLTTWNDSWNLGRVGEWMRALQDRTEGVLETIMETDTVGGLLANLLVVALVPAVCEEVFFRAGIQNLLHRWFKNGHAAVWVTALVFSLGHGEIFSFVPRFVLGALLGYLYLGSGSLLTNALAHFVNNALVVVLYWLVARGVLDIDPEAPLAVDETLTACCTLAAFAVFVVMFGKKLKTNP